MKGEKGTPDGSCVDLSVFPRAQGALLRVRVGDGPAGEDFGGCGAVNAIFLYCGGFVLIRQCFDYRRYMLSDLVHNRIAISD